MACTPKQDSPPSPNAVATSYVTLCVHACILPQSATGRSQHASSHAPCGFPACQVWAVLNTTPCWDQTNNRFSLATLQRLSAGECNCVMLVRFVMLHMSVGKGRCAPQDSRKEKRKKLRVLAIITPKAAARTFQVDRHADGCPTSHIRMLDSLMQSRQAALVLQAANNTEFMQVPVCALRVWPLSPRYWLQLLPPFEYQRGTCLPQ